MSDDKINIPWLKKNLPRQIPIPFEGILKKGGVIVNDDEPYSDKVMHVMNFDVFLNSGAKFGFKVYASGEYDLYTQTTNKLLAGRMARALVKWMFTSNLPLHVAKAMRVSLTHQIQAAYKQIDQQKAQIETLDKYILRMESEGMKS